MRPTRTVGVRELRQRATEIVRQVRVKGVAVQITYRGKVVARLVPVPENLAPSKESPAVWTDLDQLATAGRGPRRTA
jgi:prevent-host-death family protein